MAQKDLLNEALDERRELRREVARLREALDRIDDVVYRHCPGGHHWRDFKEIRQIARAARGEVE
jgi:hypothetical protein